jgi:nitroreductase
MEFHDLLDSRRTIRDFSERPVADDGLIDLLWAAQGRTSDGRRTTPSAAGRYPCNSWLLEVLSRLGRGHGHRMTAPWLRGGHSMSVPHWLLQRSGISHGSSRLR